KNTGIPKALADLEKLPFLSFSNTGAEETRFKVIQGKQQKTLNFKSIFASNNMLVLRSLATQGAGLALLPLVLLQDDLRKENLVQLFVDSRVEEIPIQVVTPHSREPLPRVQRFTEFVTKQLAPIFS